jgi:lipopolysaccharide biosynthesis glycosyltransferase
MNSDHNVAIAVVNIGKEDIFMYCLKSLEYFCEKYSCSLEIIESSKYKIEGYDGYNYAILEKNQIFDLFDRYDRILRVDTDVLINQGKTTEED